MPPKTNDKNAIPMPPTCLALVLESVALVSFLILADIVFLSIVNDL